ncbi:MAG: hypothetical protein NUV84_05585 [Candidatus Uhrbacteria bacterium]|nr:hypothetical protein [Candidatus Uhrbacteria bacterium]
MTLHPLSLEEITKLGEKLYSEEYKELFEKEYMGQYAVIDVEQKKYQIDPDRLVAIDKAKKDFGDKLFYIIQIGNSQIPSSNYSEKKYAWNF